MPSHCLKDIISRDSFAIEENKIFDLVKEWHEIHNQTTHLNTELIKTIRFELIPNKELINLANHSKLVNEKIVYKIIKERELQQNNIQSTRQFINCTKAQYILNQTFGKIFSSDSPTRQTKQISKNKLASGSIDKKIKIWNVDSGECIQTW